MLATLNVAAKTVNNGSSGRDLLVSFFQPLYFIFQIRDAFDGLVQFPGEPF